LNPLRITLTIVLVNAAGITLRYFDFDTYFIFLGFRFHLSALLPFIIFFSKKNLLLLLDSFQHPNFKSKFLPALWIVLPLIILFAVLFVLNKIKPGDPDYFYEFGLSSIIDFPLYLIWNFPQLIMLFMTLSVFSQLNKFHFFNVLVGLVLLFGYELVPFDSTLNFSNILTFLLGATTVSFFVTKLSNIYWFVTLIFSSIWGIILLIGSKYTLIINIFFAKEYGNWEGFFEISKNIYPYVIPLYFLLILITVFIYSIFKGEKEFTKKDSPSLEK
jgi:hypothetical protein